MVWYPWDYQNEELKCNLTSITLEELKESLPQNLRLPTLLEDHFIIAFTSLFQWVELETARYGPIAFWAQGKNGSEKDSAYKRLFFRTEKFGNVELVPLTGRLHHVGTELADLEKATQRDFERALEQQGLDPAKYKFTQGVMATVIEKGKEVDRIYITDNIEISILHNKFGTPLVGYDFAEGKVKKLQKVDLEASGFPEQFRKMERNISNPSTPLSHLVEAYHGSKCRLILHIENCDSCLSIHTPSYHIKDFREESDSIDDDLSPRACNHQRGFYAVKIKPF